MKFKYSVIFFFCFISWNVQAQDINESTSNVSFKISNFGFNTVSGTFTGMQGTISFDEKNPEASEFDVCINAATVNTGNKKRDSHLRKEDYFGVEEFPKICFRSSTVERTKEGFLAKGELELHGVSKAVAIPFTYIKKQFLGKLTIDRTDYNIGGNGGFSMGKEVKLEILCVLQ